MDTVFKYPLPGPFGIVTARIHREFCPLHVGLDPSGVPCLWCRVNTESETINVAMAVVGTGHAIPPNSNHAGSWVDGPYVWHAFTELRPSP